MAPDDAQLARRLLHRYWVEFEITPGELGMYPSYAGLGLGCGVTGCTWDDALRLLRERLFQNDPVPAITRVVDDVDVRHLDGGRVRPNMGSPSERGIWFPNL